MNNWSDHGTQRKQPEKVKTDAILEVGIGRHSKKMLPSMPIEIEYSPQRIALVMTGEDDDWEFCFEEPKRQVPQGRQDAYELRRSFLAIRTPEQALKFLASSGPFRRLDAWDTLLWQALLAWQSLVRWVMQRGPLRRKGQTPQSVDAFPTKFGSFLESLSQREFNWLEGSPDGIVIRAISLERRTHERILLAAHIDVHSTIEAILASVYLDSLSGVHFELCSLKGCSNLYEISSKHQRQYCSQPCAHKASVRRRRAEAKHELASQSKQTLKKSSRKAKA